MNARERENGMGAEGNRLERTPLGAPCRHCGSPDTWIEWRLEAKAPGTHSLAGMAMKLAATSHPYAVCDGCGHTSRGQQD